MMTSKAWTVGLADISKSSRGKDSQSKLPRGRSGVTVGEVLRSESPSVMPLRSSNVMFSAWIAMMVPDDGERCCTTLSQYLLLMLFCFCADFFNKLNRACWTSQVF